MNTKTDLTVPNKPDRLAGAVSADAIAHLMIKDGLNQAIYKSVRGYTMTNMSDAGDPSAGYPLVDLMSNPAPSDIGSGEMEMVNLVDDIADAVTTFAADQTAELRRLRIEVAAWRQQAVSEGWNSRLESAYGRKEYERSREAQLGELVAKRIANGLFDEAADITPPPPALQN